MKRLLILFAIFAVALSANAQALFKVNSIIYVENNKATDRDDDPQMYVRFNEQMDYLVAEVNGQKAFSFRLLSVEKTEPETYEILGKFIFLDGEQKNCILNLSKTKNHSVLYFQFDKGNGVVLFCK